MKEVYSFPSKAKATRDAGKKHYSPMDNKRIAKELSARGNKVREENKRLHKVSKTTFKKFARGIIKVI